MSSYKKRARVHNEWKTNTDDRRRKFKYYEPKYRGEEYWKEKLERLESELEGDGQNIYRGEEYWKEKLERLEAELESKERKSKGKKKKTRKRTKKYSKKRKSTRKKDTKNRKNKKFTRKK
tara:strand:- start:1 stop:360 length:360 start_codon:yes stop_codon:yes gene_type:complete